MNTLVQRLIELGCPPDEAMVWVRGYKNLSISAWRRYHNSLVLIQKARSEFAKKDVA